MRKKKTTKLIKVVLGFLHAWYNNRNSNTGDLILHRVSFVKKYITNDNDKYTVILAVQVFVHHIRNDTQMGRSVNILLLITMFEFVVQIMATIVKLFLEEQLIQIKDVLDWYEKRNSYNLVGFDKAKKCAQEFIGTLQSTTA